jgi:hypothetical protein
MRLSPVRAALSRESKIGLATRATPLVSLEELGTEKYAANHQ